MRHALNTLPWLLLPGLTGCVTPNQLCLAAGRGDAAAVENLLSNPAEAAPSGAGGWVPLECAISGGQLEIARLLIRRGEDVNVPSSRPPLNMAASRRETDIVKLLLSEGADPDVTVRKLERAAVECEKVGTSRCLQWAAEWRETVAWLKALVAEEAPRLAAEKARRERKDSEEAAKVRLEVKLSDIEAAEKAADAAARSGDAEKALARYTEALRETPRGTDKDRKLREKIIRYALSLDPRPAVPEEATRHSNRSQGFLERAQDREGYARAISELEKAAELAPWWATAYYNLGLVQEKAEDFGGAIRSLRLYLVASPDSRDAAAVKKKIDKIEVAQELAAPKRQ